MGGRLLAGVIAAVLLVGASSAQARCNLTELASLPVHMDGLRPLVDAKVNGHATRLVADSGAFFSTLSAEDAKKFDLKALPVRWVLVQGLSGAVMAKIQTAQEFSVLGHSFRNLDFVAAPESFWWSVSGLLGQNFLNVTDTEYDLSKGVIRFFHVDDCKDQTLAYWDVGAPYSVIPIRKTGQKRDIIGKVSVNGVELNAQFDTGTAYSVLSMKGAARAGIKKGDPRLKPGGVSSGIGWRLNQTWIAPVDSFKIGDEEIRQTGLRVTEFELPDADMLIGADFFLSHHILVANSQQQLYLTYNGGPVFKLEVIPDTKGDEAKTPPAGARAVASAPAEVGPDPKDADGFVRRAEASAARRDYAAALADFDHALALAPKDPAILYARARTKIAKDDTKAALADLDEALKAKPNDVDMLMVRGQVRLKEKQLALAKADFDMAKSRDPDQASTVAAAYDAEEDYADAVAEYDERLRAARAADDKAALLQARCWARAEWNHELDKALADCDASDHVSSWRRTAGFTRGLLYLRLGRYADAIRELSMAIRAQPRLSLAIYLRGVAKIRTGKAAEGETDIKAAMAIEPKVGDRAKAYGLAAQPADAKS